VHPLPRQLDGLLAQFVVPLDATDGQLAEVNVVKLVTGLHPLLSIAIAAVVRVPLLAN